MSPYHVTLDRSTSVASILGPEGPVYSRSIANDPDGAWQERLEALAELLNYGYARGRENNTESVKK